MRTLSKPLWLLAVLFTTLPSGAHALTFEEIKATGVMVLCADPANLPLSDQRFSPPGYDLEVAAEIAKSLGAKLRYNWFATSYTARVLRELDQGNCDFMVGLPTDKSLEGANPRIAVSRPYLTSGFVIVTTNGVQAKTLDDLKGTRVGVEMNTVADFRMFGLGHQRGLYRNQAEIFKALSHGELKSALMWAPMAGWLSNIQPESGLMILPELRSDLTFPLGIAVRKSDPELLAAVNAVIEKLMGSGQLDQILARYNFPIFLRTSTAAISISGASAPRTAAPSEQRPSSNNNGSGLYHSACGKCHGRSAISGGIYPDLRKFTGTDAEFIDVVKNGRPGTAMVPWKDFFSEDEIHQIHQYIRSVTPRQ